VTLGADLKMAAAAGLQARQGAISRAARQVEATARWRRKNPAKVAAQKARWRARYPEKVAAQRKRWRERQAKRRVGG
jgi:hypothetical protein